MLKDQSKKSAYQFTCSTMGFMNQAFLPLRKSFGMTSLAYIKYFYDSRIMLIINGFKNYVERYFDGIEQEGKTFVQMMKSTPLNTYRYFIWPHNHDVDPAMGLRHECNRWNGMSIVYRNIDCIEMMTFAFDRNSPDKTNFFINNSPVLLKFMESFRDSAADTIDHTDKNKIVKYSKDFDLSYDSNDYALNAEGIGKQISECALIFNTDKGLVELSPPELEYIKLIDSGRSIRDISVASRTKTQVIMKYLSNARRKAFATSNAELIKIVMRNL